jgi:hypothetical protein
LCDVDINTSDYSGLCAPTKQSGILIPNFLFILFRQWKHVFCFVCSGTTDRNETELHSRWRHSDSRTAAACDGLPDHVWTWIQACKYFMESSCSLLSYASNLKSISCWSRPQSLFWCRDLFLPTVLRHLILAHWVMYHVESNSDAS